MHFNTVSLALFLFFIISLSFTKTFFLSFSHKTLGLNDLKVNFAPNQSFILNLSYHSLSLSLSLFLSYKTTLSFTRNSCDIATSLTLPHLLLSHSLSLCKFKCLNTSFDYRNKIYFSTLAEMSLTSCHVGLCPSVFCPVVVAPIRTARPIYLSQTSALM